MAEIKFKVPSASWNKKVYHPKTEEPASVEWKAIAKVVKARDKHTCQSCKVKIGLGVHHILPRSEGGTDYPPNLITLCRNCHDEIEDMGLTERLQILDFKQKRKYIKHSTVIYVEPTDDWHKWVYGGSRKRA